MSIFQEVAASRPKADHSIEQFLMQAVDLESQIQLVGPHLENKKVFFLGDDDHISPLLAHEFGVSPIVYEYDERIRDSLLSLFGKLGVRNYTVKEYDAQDQIIDSPLCDGFYINPPYSSKANGLGIKVWLMRTLEACIPECSGVLVMPRDGGNIGEEWVNNVQNSVDQFITKNGFSITNFDLNVSRYLDTNNSNLMSSNLYLKRTDISKLETIETAGLYN